MKFHVRVFFLFSGLFLSLSLCTQGFSDELLSIDTYEKLVKEHPDNAEDFYHLARAYGLKNQWENAVGSYKRSLEINPENSDAEVGLGFALLHQYDAKLNRELLEASKKAFHRALKQSPEYADAETGLKKANRLLEELDHRSAPEKEEKKREELEKEEAKKLLSDGNKEILEENYWEARAIFLGALEISPDDASVLLKLAQVDALLEEFDDAEDYYLQSLHADAERADIRRSFAGFLWERRRFTESEWNYRLSEQLEKDNKLRYTLFDLTAYTQPSVFAHIGTAEERERDQVTHKPVASLLYAFGDVTFLYPYRDRFRTSVKIRGGTTTQRLLVSHINQFSVKGIGIDAKEEWFYNPYWTFSFTGSVEWFANNKQNVELKARRTLNFEPNLFFRYSKGADTLSFGETSDSIFYRDFKRNKLLLPTRIGMLLFYQHNFGSQRLVGTEGLWLWYQDPIHNQEQDASIFLQTGLPYFEDTLSVRYQCVYRHFRKDTSAYYSFRYELTQWLKFRWFKRWDCGMHCELEYWHGWRTTRGRNPQQQLIISPLTQDFPITTVENEIDQLFLTVGYTPSDAFDISVGGNYYFDSFDYLVVGIKLLLDWRY